MHLTLCVNITCIFALLVYYIRIILYNFSLYDVILQMVLDYGKHTCNGFSARALSADRLNAFGSFRSRLLATHLNKRQETPRSWADIKPIAALQRRSKQKSLHVFKMSLFGVKPRVNRNIIARSKLMTRINDFTVYLTLHDKNTC